MGAAFSGALPRAQPWEIELNASSDLCTQMVQSFGAWITLLGNLFPKEQIRLQRLNKWQYNVAVSRVQVRLDVRESAHIFISKTSSKVWAYISWSGEVRELAPSKLVDFQGYSWCQISNDRVFGHYRGTCTMI